GRIPLGIFQKLLTNHGVNQANPQSCLETFCTGLEPPWSHTVQPPLGCLRNPTRHTFLKGASHNQRLVDASGLITRHQPEIAQYTHARLPGNRGGSSASFQPIPAHPLGGLFDRIKECTQRRCQTLLIETSRVHYFLELSEGLAAALAPNVLGQIVCNRI